jgi:hypothetical protein
MFDVLTVDDSNQLRANATEPSSKSVIQWVGVERHLD